MSLRLHQRVNSYFAPLFEDKRRYTILMGGRGAGRSTAASQYMLANLASPNYFRCAIMRLVLSDIRQSIYRELVDRINEQNAEGEIGITENSMTVTYGENTINAVGFRKSSSDRSAKLKSLANYNVVVIEEADEVPEEDFMQLDDTLRTLKGGIRIILCLNPPPKNHWIIKRWFDLYPVVDVDGFFIPWLKPDARDDVTFLYNNYLDNAHNLDEHTLKRYEAYKYTKPSYYYNMVRGYVPEVARGKIYKNWQIIDELPHEARLLCYGLDFGFDPDPAAIVAIYSYNGGFILDEVLYETEYRNRQLAAVIKNRDKAPVVADCAEPKSIAELEDMGIYIIPTEKGPDSVRTGIQHVQDQRISVTKRSKNLINEYDEYQWKTNKDGEDQPVPDPKCKDHLLDACRYGLSIQHVNVLDEKGREKEREKRIARQTFDPNDPLGD